MTITTLPAAPTSSDIPADFNTKAFALLGALSTFVSETNSLAGTVNTDATTATTQAGIAITQAGLATSNGATQVGLAAAQVALATTQAGLATTNGAAQVALATTQVGYATTQASNAAISATTATNYAQKTDGYVTGTDNSAKSWALGGAGSGQPAAGPAIDWATKLATSVNGSEYSAKEYAIGDITANGGSAKAWAIDTSSPNGGTDKSAKTWATEAAASAVTAANLAGAFTSTSTTSWTPAIGSKTFTIQSGEQYVTGTYILIVSSDTPSAYGFGQVTTYSGTTLIVDVQVVGGTGSHTDWNITLSGLQGIKGDLGDTGPAGAPDWLIKSSNYTAITKNRIAVTTAGGSFTVTLPAAPSASDYVEFCDAGKALSTYNLTVARNGSTIEGLAEDMTVSTNSASFGLMYTGTTWRIY